MSLEPRAGSPSSSGNANDRRQHHRIKGPFDAWRVAAIDTPLRIHDLSEGGCFVNALHDQRVGVTMLLAIDLPHEGRITVKAKTLYRKPDFGFAVRFVDMSPETSERLKRAIQRLEGLEPHDV
jgi:hypothetical protein